MLWFCFHARIVWITAVGSNFILHARKMPLKKSFFSKKHFLASENLWPVIRGSYPRYKSSLQFP